MSDSTIGFSPSTKLNLEGVKKVASLDPRLSRTDYFDGRLLTATDLIRDQTYVDERVLEVGRVLGSGVVRGLLIELSEDKRFLQVEPGIAVSESGRVLEVTADKPLKIDLYDRALLMSLNQGRYRRFNRGLYAVTLQYVEIGSDSAESYPNDPTEKNEFQYDSFVEGAEITLTPLTQPLPSDDELVSRAALAQHFLSNPGQLRVMSDQAVALGVLAFNNDRPQWLDVHLLRRPMRPEHVPAAWQMDLQRHFLELLDFVMLERHSQSQYGQFAASQYFNLLPPSGVLPVACVDPIKSAQYFFPENYEISISPVRYEDLAVIQSESMQLAALDLSSDEAAEIMILAPMTNELFIKHARSLGYKPETDTVPEGEPNYWLHATDILQQRLSTTTSSIASDNARTVWMNIWRTLGDGLLHYVRRPARAAETQVSAVVLAHGFNIPTPSEDIDDVSGEQSEKIAALEQENKTAKIALVNAKKEIVEAEQRLLKCEEQNNSGSDNDNGLVQNGIHDIENVLDMRGTRDPKIRKAAIKAVAQLIKKEADVMLASSILKHVHVGFDSVIWQTMAAASRKAKLDTLNKIVVKSVDSPMDLAKNVAENADQLGVSRAVAKKWITLAEKLI